MTVDQVINNVKCEINTRLSEYEQKAEEFNILYQEHPEYPKYREAKKFYDIKYIELQDLLKELEDFAWGEFSLS